MLMYMLQVANPSSSFWKRLKALLKEYEDVISVGAMGFPEDWEKEKIWEN
jgi:abortive infection bacteriophage resistance protein